MQNLKFFKAFKCFIDQLLASYIPKKSTTNCSLLNIEPIYCNLFGYFQTNLNVPNFFIFIYFRHYYANYQSMFEFCIDISFSQKYDQIQQQTGSRFKHKIFIC